MFRSTMIALSQTFKDTTFLPYYLSALPIAVAERSETWTVFAAWMLGQGSNKSRGINVYLCYFVSVLFWV
jgi:hypothetical protein